MFKKKNLLFSLITLILFSGLVFAAAPVTSFNYLQVPLTFDVNIGLACAATDSNCNKIEYRIDNGAWTTINNTNYSSFSDTNFSQFEGANIAADGWTTHNGAPVTAAAAVKEGAKGYSSAGSAYASKAVVPSDTNYTFWMHCANGGVNNSNNWVEFDWDAATHGFGGATSNGIIFAYNTNAGGNCEADLRVRVGGAYTYEGAVTISQGWKKGQIIINDNNTAKIYWFAADGTTLLDSNTNVILPNGGLQYVRLMTENNTRYHDAIHTFNGVKSPNFDYNFQYTGTAGTHTIDYNSTAVDASIEATKTSPFTIIGDGTNPTITFTTSPSILGFVNDFNFTFNLTCQDNYLNDLIFDINSITDTNNYNFYHVTDANGTKTTNFNLPLLNQIYFKAKCTDANGNYATADSNSYYAVLFRLINEDTGAPVNNFPVMDINGAKVFTYDGNKKYDFYDTNTFQKYFLGESEIVRFEFEYDDGTIINRDIDFSLLPDQNAGICVAPQQDTWYVQRVISSIERPVLLFNDYAECYNLSGYTRFAYENALSLTGYTINKPYQLYTWINDVKTLLADIDGSNASNLSLDVLIFNTQSEDISLEFDILSIAPYVNVNGVHDQNIMQIYYFNQAEDNTTITLKIYDNTDSNLLWEYTENVSPNEILINWIYTGYDLNLNTPLKLVLIKTNADGTDSKTIYFDLTGTIRVGVLDAPIAVLLAFLVFAFFISLTAYRTSIGWIGVLGGVISLMILALAPQIWYVSLFEVVIVVSIIFIVLVTIKEGRGLI